jgi:hypothetical protein
VATLYLHCAICSRKQAEGLLSGAAWGKVELPTGTAVDHPSVKGSAARACPTCVAQFSDWQDRAMTSLGLSGGGFGPPQPATA